MDPQTATPEALPQGDAPALDAPVLDATPAPAPQTPFKMFVSFVVSTGTGQIFSSMILNGIPDIVTSTDVENVQRAIAEQMKVQAVSLMFWKHLYI